MESSKFVLSPFIIHCSLFAAPHVAPSDIQFRSSTATTVRISWLAVDPYALNGVLVGYNVTCWQGTNLITYVHTTTENANVTGLKFNSMYKVSVAAISSGGLGVYSKYTNVTTSQNGKCRVFYIPVLCVVNSFINCIDAHAFHKSKYYSFMLNSHHLSLRLGAAFAPSA